MGNSPFRSFTKPKAVKTTFSEAQVLAVARQLLDDHAAAREAATRQLNQVCGNCHGAGNVGSTLMPGESVKCFACEGTGKPNDKVQSLPELDPADNERIWKLGRLLEGPHRLAIVALIREYFPEMYASGVTDAPN